MAYKTGILFGTIAKINSYDGSVTVRLEKNFIDNIPEMGSVFIEIEGKPVPFFISEYDYPGAGTIKLVFEDYDTPGKIKSFRGCRIFLTFSENTADLKPLIPSIEGFRIFDRDNDLIGTVREVIDNPGQLMLDVVSPSNRQILIPLHNDLILNIDEKKKVIVMSLPEGLTGIN